jgi:hypothetical protein
MTAILTNTNVFDFMGTPADVRTTQGSQITALIANMQAEFQRVTGRSPEQVTLTDYVMSESDYEIYGDKMYLRGSFRDLNAITKLYEDGSEIAVATGSTSNGYKFDSRLGIIYRVGSSWLSAPLTYKVTGTYGLNSSAEVKQIITEMVAARSGLWKSAVQTQDGKIETIRTNITDQTMDSMKRYRLLDC